MEMATSINYMYNRIFREGCLLLLSLYPRGNVSLKSIELALPINESEKLLKQLSVNELLTSIYLQEMICKVLLSVEESEECFDLKMK